MKLVSLLFALGACAGALVAQPPTDIQKRLDDFVAGTGGGAALAWVDRDGVVLLQAGKYSEDDPREITADTQFEIGSISKVFTALLLAESERLGRVCRHDPAAKYLFPADDPDQEPLARITLRSLTTHTSGLPRMPANFGGSGADPYANYGRPRMLAAFRYHGHDASPGDRVAYSNFGVGLLGEALAAAWSTTYAEALSTHVLRPLGLQHTSVGVAKVQPPPELAPGHKDGHRVPNWRFQAFAAAGAVRSSAREMAIFLQACLRDSGPLSAAFQETLEPQFPTENGGQIGLGWFLFDDPEVPGAWHNGATAGSHAFIAFSRKAGRGIVILANSSKPSEALGFRLLGRTQKKITQR